ncbi:hypothetical protein T439DRAFT_323542 [Meredithblackwellia eburnea MCA 4105]
MGLASKLAAAQQNQGGAGAPPPPNPYAAQQTPTSNTPAPAAYGQQPAGVQQQQNPYAQQGQNQQQQTQPGQGQQGQQNPYGQQSSYAPPSGNPPPVPGARPGPPGGQPQGQGQYGAPPGAPPAYGQPPQGQQGQGQGQYGGGGYGQQQQPPQSQYGAPPSQGQYGQQNQYGAPQSQYGAPPQQGQYGAPPPQGGAPGAQGGAPSAASDPNTILNILRQCVQDQNIQAFYPQGSLEPIAQNVARSGALQKLSTEWRMPLEIAMDLAKLALFDTVLYLDDSGSMTFEEGGSRIDDLKLIISRVAMATSLFDQDGIQVRFMNSKIEGNNINNEQAALALVSQVKFSGLTPLGTALQNKILEPLVLGPARAGRLQKPVLVIAVTDGVPGGEDRYAIVKAIVNANRTLQQTRYGPDAVSFQLAQVGNDLKARAFLEEIDRHPEIGGLVDTTSNYENEADDMLKANPPVELTPELWLVKLLMGGIDSSYDTQDE